MLSLHKLNENQSRLGTLSTIKSLKLEAQVCFSLKMIEKTPTIAQRLDLPGFQKILVQVENTRETG